jgi:hypothetical protein
MREIMRTFDLLWAGIALSGIAAGCGGSVETAAGGSTATGSGGAGGSTTTSSSSTITTSGSTTTGMGGTGGTTMPTGGTGGTTIGTGGGATLAFHKLLLGDTTPNGTVSMTAWKQYGFDVDGKISTNASVDLCKPAAGGKASAVYPDGDNGIDNSFGKNIMPILTSLASDFSTQSNQQIATGRFTVLVHIQDLVPGQSGTFPAALYTGGYPANVSPAWQGADAWPVRADSLVNGDLSSPKTLFPMSTVTVDAAGGRLWQSVSLGDIDLQLVTAGIPFVLPIRSARLAMTLSGDDAHAVSGRIGGVIDTEAFIKELAKVAGSFDPTLCPPSSTFEAIAQQVRQAQDILGDGTQDPLKTCNAISVGLGFEADAALLGAVFTPVASPDPCNP